MSWGVSGPSLERMDKALDGIAEHMHLSRETLDGVVKKAADHYIVNLHLTASLKEHLRADKAIPVDSLRAYIFEYNSREYLDVGALVREVVRLKAEQARQKAAEEAALEKAATAPQSKPEEERSPTGTVIRRVVEMGPKGNYAVHRPDQSAPDVGNTR